MKRVETIIIGGGQAGLATSYWLKSHGRENLVLDRADRPGYAWRQRWDSFALATPNWTFRLPGAEYGGDDRNGFMPRDQIVACFERYAADSRLPVRFGVDVIAVEAFAGRPGYLVRTQEAQYEAANVVVATGLYQRAKIPAFAAGLPADVLQLASEQYRNPAGLPPGMAARMNLLTRQALAGEELRRSFADLGAAPWWTTAEDLEAYRTAQEAALRPLIRASGARVE